MKRTFPGLHPTRAFLVGISLLAIGCGEPASSPAAGAGPRASVDTCRLLTPDEIASEVGHAVGDGVDPGGVVPTCQWPRQGETTPFVPVVQITLVPDAAGSFEHWSTMMRADMEGSGFEFKAGDYRRVDGVGEWAVYIADGGLLMSGQRGQMLQVMVSGGPDDSRQVALARLALARMP